MKIAEILEQPSMPISSPSYPRGPYRFLNREYMNTTYESDPDAIRHALPEPLEPDGSNCVVFEVIRMPDSSGFGDYTEAGIVIPALFDGKPVNFTAQMYLDDTPPIFGGREVWGFPKKLGNPTLSVKHDTMIGELLYNDDPVAHASMTYKYVDLLHDLNTGEKRDASTILQKMGKTQVNLKLIPHVDGSLAIAQLVAYEMTNIELKGAWSGDARLRLNPNVNAPLADLPVRKVVGGQHLIADMTLPYGRVLHDYLKG